MAVHKNTKVKIIPKPAHVSWEEITDLLQAAFAEKAERGMDYLATYQDAETTKKRVGDGICFVALIDEKVVGTTTLQFKEVAKNNRKWHTKSRYGIIVQLGVHPNYKGLGIGRQLIDELVKTAKENKLEAIIGDTSSKAKELLSWYKKLGFEYIGLLSYASTNYYSILLRKPLKDTEFNPVYRNLKFYKSVLKCYMLKNKNGDIRKIWKVLK